MKRIVSATLLALSFMLGGRAMAQIIRAPQMTPKLWSQFNSGTTDNFLIEFRQGDIIPVRLAVQGDFLESTGVGTTDVAVKRTFWLQLQGKVLMASLDGSHFKPINQIATGSFTAGGWHGSGPVGMINLALQAYLK